MSTEPAAERPPRRTGKIIGFVLFTAFFVGLWAGLRWLNHNFDAATTPLGGDTSQRTIEIPEGASSWTIAHRLQTARLIDDPRLLVMWVRFKGLDGQLKYGEYRFSRQQSLADMVDRLARGEVLTHRFTIREGETIKHVARELEAEGLAKADDVLRLAADPGFLAQHGIDADSLEGYLYPETYDVARGLSTEELLAIMIEEFRERTAHLKEAFAASQYSRHEIVTIASIIEKEVIRKEEMPVVSAVIHNRLERGMRLQCDVTIRYPLDNYGTHLTYADLKADSPYNSYTRKGLPPTPICSPSAEAIDAALHPAKADYLYFVSMNNGSHHFSSSYAEHRAYVQKHQKQGIRGTIVPDWSDIETGQRPGKPLDEATEVVPTAQAFPELEDTEAVEVAVLAADKPDES